MALFEDKGKVGGGLHTTALYFRHIWLNNEGSIGLEEKQRGLRQIGHFVSEGTMATTVFL